MKIALTKKNKYNNTTPSYELSTAKKTSNTKPQLQFRISPLDDAQYESILTNKNQHSNKEETDTEETLLIYIQ